MTDRRETSSLSDQEVSAYVSRLVAEGRNHFVIEDIRSSIELPWKSVRSALRELKDRREIAEPFRDFYVIVRPACRPIGCLPPEEFVPGLMAYWGEYYYLSLLSAAEFHGAAHHRPQTFQVMYARETRTVVCGNVRIQLIKRNHLERMPVAAPGEIHETIRVASPETTAFEIVGYPHLCAGIDNVATVLAELAEVLDASRLVSVAGFCPTSWAQRLGFLLDLVEQKSVAEPLAAYVQSKSRRFVPLLAKSSDVSGPRDRRWNVLVNAVVESDV